MKKGGAKAKKFIMNLIVHVGLAVMAFMQLLSLYTITTEFKFYC